MNDMVDRKLTVRGNNNLIYLADELWQFGIISNGCYYEIKLAMELQKPVRFFRVGKDMQSIQELNIDQLEYEQELENECDMQKFQKELECYIHH